jgi:L-alanine-DL-glutamate epimerase-like enolase superfamily enzyme
MALLRDHLAPQLIGTIRHLSKSIWRDLLFRHATSVASSPALALARSTRPLWDWRCRRDNQPLWLAAGGAERACRSTRRKAAGCICRSGRWWNGRWPRAKPDFWARRSRLASGNWPTTSSGSTRCARRPVRISLMIDANQCFTARPKR